jgi:threonine dehydratase
VSEEELRAATVLMIGHTRNLIEPAGAAALAAALRLRERLAGKRVVLIASGGNVTRAQLRDLLG